MLAGGRAGTWRDQRRTHRADRLARRAGPAFAAEDFHAGRCGAVIDLPRAVAARAGLVAARPGQCDLGRFVAACAAHGGSLAEQEQNENRESDGMAMRCTEAAAASPAVRGSAGAPKPAMEPAIEAWNLLYSSLLFRALYH